MRSGAFEEYDVAAAVHAHPDATVNKFRRHSAQVSPILPTTRSEGG